MCNFPFRRNNAMIVTVLWQLLFSTIISCFKFVNMSIFLFIFYFCTSSLHAIILLYVPEYKFIHTYSSRKKIDILRGRGVHILHDTDLKFIQSPCNTISGITSVSISSFFNLIPSPIQALLCPR